jgi:hypothetical protein
MLLFAGSREGWWLGQEVLELSQSLICFLCSHELLLVLE